MANTTANSIALNMKNIEKGKEKVDSRISSELIFFQGARKRYEAYYNFYRKLLIVIKILINIGQVSALLGSSAFAIWGREWAQIIIPILGISGTLLFMVEETVKKAGLSKTIEKYRKLTLKAMKCEEEMIALHIQLLKDGEISTDEILEIDRTSLRLRHELTKLCIQFDKVVDQTIEFFDTAKQTKTGTLPKRSGDSRF